MRKYVLMLIFILCIMLLGTKENVFAKELPKEEVNIVVLKGTDETKDGFPVYEIEDDNKNFMDVYNDTFIKKAVELYRQAQQYSNIKSQDMYFAFRKNSGCYGRIGFYLKKDGQLYDKREAPCIELSPNMIRGNYDILQSITQILPHEMGHVLQAITTYDGKEINQNVVDMHESNVTTEYTTAFSEGFGEHFEVISRMYEENKQIKEGIYFNIDRTKRNVQPLVEGYARDFQLPLRLDYYREICPLWQSKFEGIKREELGINGDGKYKNLSYEFQDPEKTILYRNMGISQDKTKMKSLEQSLSTEIVVSNFFVKLITTDIGDLDEKYSKIFNVFNKYLNKDDKPQLIEFVKGYIEEYPEDKDRVLENFKDSTGYDFTEECAPEIWCISEDEHSNIIFDQFRGVGYPFYIFNINTCENEDLLKVKGIDKSDADKIIEYREKNNGIKEIQEISQINGISSKTIDILTNNTNKENIEKIKNAIDEHEFEESFFSIFRANIEHLILKSLLWFIIFFIAYYLIFIKNTVKTKINLFKISIKSFLKLNFYVAMGLISVGISSTISIKNKPLNPTLIFIVVIFISECVTLLIIRKDKLKIKNSLISAFMMMAIILYSQY